MDVEKVIDSVVATFIGTKHERDVKRIQPMVEAINALEPEMQKLSDEQIGARTLELKSEVQARIEGSSATTRITSGSCKRRWSLRLCPPSHSRARRAAAPSACGILTCN